MIRSLFLVTIALCVASAGITVKHIDGTTTAYPEDQLQKAIDDPLTVCGDIIEIDPGASRHGYYPYFLRGPALSPSLGGPAVPPSYAKDCASSGKYITIRSSLAYQLTPGKRVGPSDAANLAFVGMLPDFVNVNGIGCTVFTTERASSYWRLQGLEIAATPAVVSDTLPGCSSGGSAIVKSTYVTNGGNAGNIEYFPHHIIIDQCWIHGVDSFQVRDGINLDGMSISLINSTVENIRTSDASGQESHAITIVHGRGPLRIVNNKISAGQNSLIVGGFPPISKRTAEDVEFSGNWIYRPFKWMDWHGTTDPTPLSPCPVDSDGHGATYRNISAVTYWECRGAAPGTWTQLADAATYNALVAIRIPALGKNLMEWKRATRWHIEGNLIDQASSLNQTGQTGACFAWAAIDGPDSGFSGMRVENNICQYAETGFLMGRDGDHAYFWPPEAGSQYWQNNGRNFYNIIFRNNIFRHMGRDMTTKPAFGDLSFFTQMSLLTSFGHLLGDGITLDHQTWQSEYTGTNNLANAGIRTGDAPYDPTQPSINQRIINSIITAARCPLGSSAGVGCNGNAIASGWGPNAELSANAFVNNLGFDVRDHNIVGGVVDHCDPASGLPGCVYKTAYNTYPPSCLGCRIDSPSGMKFTNYPNDLTLLSGSPLRAAGLDGKDIGADLNIVGWATAGAQAGSLAPYLAMKIRAVIPAATSVQVRFSAIDTSSCTVEARVYGFPLATPVAMSTDDTGTLDRLVTLPGLSGNTKYGLKVTCAGTYYREDEFRTP